MFLIATWYNYDKNFNYFVAFSQLTKKAPTKGALYHIQRIGRGILPIEC